MTLNFNLKITVGPQSTTRVVCYTNASRKVLTGKNGMQCTNTELAKSIENLIFEDLKNRTEK